MKMKKLIDTNGLFSCFYISNYNPSKSIQTQIHAKLKNSGNDDRWDIFDRTSKREKFDLKNTVLSIFNEIIESDKKVTKQKEKLEFCRFYIYKKSNELKEREQQRTLEKNKDESEERELNQMQDIIDIIERKIEVDQENEEVDQENEEVDQENEEVDQENEEVDQDKKQNSNKRRTDYSHLWVQCEFCYGVNYKSLFNSKLYICEWCQAHVRMNSLVRIDFLIDPDTWIPMDEDIISMDSIKWDEEVKPFDFVKWESDMNKIIEDDYEFLLKRIDKMEMDDNIKKDYIERVTKYYINFKTKGIIDTEESKDTKKSSDQDILEIEDQYNNMEQEVLYENKDGFDQDTIDTEEEIESFQDERNSFEKDILDKKEGIENIAKADADIEKERDKTEQDIIDTVDEIENNIDKINPETIDILHIIDQKYLKEDNNIERKMTIEFIIKLEHDYVDNLDKIEESITPEFVESRIKEYLTPEEIDKVRKLGSIENIKEYYRQNFEKYYRKKINKAFDKKMEQEDSEKINPETIDIFHIFKLNYFKEEENIEGRITLEYLIELEQSYFTDLEELNKITPEFVESRIKEYLTPEEIDKVRKLGSIENIKEYYRQNFEKYYRKKRTKAFARKMEQEDSEKINQETIDIINIIDQDYHIEYEENIDRSLTFESIYQLKQDYLDKVKKISKITKKYIDRLEKESLTSEEIEKIRKLGSVSKIKKYYHENIDKFYFNKIKQYEFTKIKQGLQDNIDQAVRYIIENIEQEYIDKEKTKCKTIRNRNKVTLESIIQFQLEYFEKMYEIDKISLESIERLYKKKYITEEDIDKICKLGSIENIKGYYFRHIDKYYDKYYNKIVNQYYSKKIKDKKTNKYNIEHDITLEYIYQLKQEYSDKIDEIDKIRLKYIDNIDNKAYTTIEDEAKFYKLIAIDYLHKKDRKKTDKNIFKKIDQYYYDQIDQYYYNKMEQEDIKKEKDNFEYEKDIREEDIKKEKDNFEYEKDIWEEEDLYMFDQETIDIEDEINKLETDDTIVPEEEEEEKTYEERLNYYQHETGFNDAIQTGIAKFNGIPIALGVMDFQFIAGTMGPVVGEKITRLIEYASKEFLPLIIVCASGGARMQEGSLSLMQMGKITCALYNYKLDKKLLYVSILASPTTGGVTASFGMLGHIIISEPGATIAFAGKIIIEEILKIEVPEGAQEAESLFPQGAFDLILPRKYFKRILSLLYLFHNYRN